MATHSDWASVQHAALEIPQLIGADDEDLTVRALSNLKSIPLTEVFIG